MILALALAWLTAGVLLALLVGGAVRLADARSSRGTDPAPLPRTGAPDAAHAA